MKKVLVVLCISVFALLLSTQITYAFVELTDSNGNEYSVDITYAADYYTLYTIRTVEETITDDSRFSQHYDTVNFNTLYGGVYDLDDLYAAGYRTMAVEITIDIREVQDGYQYIYIYDDTTTTTYLRGMQFEHTPGSKDTSWATYTFYFEVDIANVTNNNFVIRYSASGWFNDDWVNKNLKIQVGWSEDILVTNHIWEINSSTFTSLPIAT